MDSWIHSFHVAYPLLAIMCKHDVITDSRSSTKPEVHNVSIGRGSGGAGGATNDATAIIRQTANQFYVGLCVIDPCPPPYYKIVPRPMNILQSDQRRGGGPRHGHRQHAQKCGEVLT